MMTGQQEHFSPRSAVEPVLRWFVLVVLGGLERIAKMHLDEHRVLTFLPLVQTERRRPPTGRAPDLPYIVVPRFPGYLFVNLAANDPRWALLERDCEQRPRGVIDALRAENGNAIPVPSVQIDRWLAMADKDGIVEHWAPPPKRRWFDPGAVVKVKHGPYVGKAGVVMRQDKGNVRLWIGNWPVTLRWDEIEEDGY